MKTIKTVSLLAIALVVTINFSYSQEKAPTMFVVHTDHVKFEKMQQYEEVAKQMKMLMDEHQTGDAYYSTISVEDGRYVYVSPISSMADLDKNPMEGLYNKLGKEKFESMLNKMDECYDSHHDNIVHVQSDLSYLPEGYSNNGKNHREYHFLYYAPRNSEAMKEAMANVKEMFKSKNIKNGYEVYHSGFGSDETYYMVAVSGENHMTTAKIGNSNNEIMGEEGNAAFFEVIKLATRYDQVEATYREDLSYLPKN